MKTINKSRNTKLTSSASLLASAHQMADSIPTEKNPCENSKPKRRKNNMNKNSKIMIISALALTAFGPQTIARNQNPISPQVAHAIKTTPGTKVQQDWLKASPEQRNKMGESIGNRGARQFAKEQNWERVFDGSKPGISQGPDQVYRDAKGKIHAIEAKGGGSPLGKSFGYPQGTSENMVKSSEFTLKSSKASPAQKKGAQAVLNAAANGNLEVHVVRTKHVLGKAESPVEESNKKTSSKAKKLAKDSLSKQMSLKMAKGGKEIAKVACKAAKTAAKVIAPFGAMIEVTSLGNRSDEIEAKVENGQITRKEAGKKHAGSIAEVAGGFSGAMFGAMFGAGSGAAFGSVVPVVGTTVCAITGGLVGAYQGGKEGGTTGKSIGEKVAESSEKIRNAANWTGQKMNDAFDSVKETQTGKLIGEVVAESSKKIRNAANSTGQKINNAYDSVTETATAAGNQIKRSSRAASREIQKGWNSVKNCFSW